MAAETQYLAIQPLAEVNIAFQKLQKQPQEQPQKQPQEQPEAAAEVQHGEPLQAPNNGHNKRLSSRTPGNYVFSGSGLLCFERVFASPTDVSGIYLRVLYHYLRVLYSRGPKPEEAYIEVPARI